VKRLKRNSHMTLDRAEQIRKAFDLLDFPLENPTTPTGKGSTFPST